MPGKQSNSKLQSAAERRLKRVLKQAQGVPALRRLGPKCMWKVHVSLLSSAQMKKLNKQCRGKDYATDVLSFEAPLVFRSQGLLGDIVICVPVLKRQARELDHAPETELQILLVHGVLHLLGFDHEKGARAEQEMQRWEAKLLGARASKRGLISRNGFP